MNSPQYYIANDFIFGYIPSSVLTIDKFTDILSASLSIQQQYGYICVWSGGAHQEIRGYVTFVDMDQQ